MSALRELVKNPSTVLVDVRNQWEYEMEHIPGAMNIPLDQVPAKIEEFRSLQKPLVIYCRSGSRSGMAVSILKQKGITDVYNGGGLGDIQLLIN
ncbi:MAG: rhodanese-like domain-containing protein [Chitinophagaceae bacterium]|nr:rhodanese-like domain-containing protein [Chitinophagaceae bacterium]